MPEFPGLGYMPLVLGSVVFFYGGWVFLAGAVREIQDRLPGMMTLIGIAISAAYVWSVYAVFAGAEALFWELTTLITIMLLGHWLEMRAVGGAQGALKELSKLLPDTAEIIRDGKTEIIALSELKENDLVLVNRGRKYLLDKTGTLTEGAFGVISFSSDETLQLAASVDAHSEHPIALGIVAEAKKRNLSISEPKNFKRIPGVGGEAEVEGQIRVFCLTRRSRRY